MFKALPSLAAEIYFSSKCTQPYLTKKVFLFIVSSSEVGRNWRTTCMSKKYYMYLFDIFTGNLISYKHVSCTLPPAVPPPLLPFFLPLSLPPPPLHPSTFLPTQYLFGSSPHALPSSFLHLHPLLLSLHVQCDGKRS